MPKKGERLRLKVDKVIKTGAFLSREGDERSYFLHITEISDKWVDDINEYVKENEELECRYIGKRRLKNRTSYQVSLKKIDEKEYKNKEFNAKMDEFFRRSSERHSQLRKRTERLRSNRKRRYDN